MPKTCAGSDASSKPTTGLTKPGTFRSTGAVGKTVSITTDSNNTAPPLQRRIRIARRSSSVMAPPSDEEDERHDDEDRDQDRTRPQHVAAEARHRHTLLLGNRLHHEVGP